MQGFCLSLLFPFKGVDGEEPRVSNPCSSPSTPVSLPIRLGTNTLPGDPRRISLRKPPEVSITSRERPTMSQKLAAGTVKLIRMASTCSHGSRGYTSRPGAKFCGYLPNTLLVTSNKLRVLSKHAAETLKHFVGSLQVGSGDHKRRCEKRPSQRVNTLQNL